MKLVLEEVERRYILRVLHAAGGNKSLAAQRLGLSRRTLYRKLGEYGVELPPDARAEDAPWNRRHESDLALLGRLSISRSCGPRRHISRPRRTHGGTAIATEVHIRSIVPIGGSSLAGVGTQIWDASRSGALPGFAERFAQGWDLGLIERTLETLPGVLRQPPAFLHPYKSSWYLHGATKEAIETIEEQLRRLGLDVVVVYSGQRYLDVLPRHASKGKALTWLAKHLGIADLGACVTSAWPRPPRAERAVLKLGGPSIRRNNALQSAELCAQVQRNAHRSIPEPLNADRAHAGSRCGGKHAAEH